MLIAGSGSPTVVFDTGGGGSLEGWGTVPKRVSTFAKTVSFDRAGNGLSDKATTPRDAKHIAAELHTTLRNANVPPPYVLVGHSVGGPYARVFAGMYPDDVAGMVLIDPTQEEVVSPERLECGLSERSCAAVTLAQAHASSIPANIPVSLIHVMYNWGPTPFPSKDRDEIAKSQMLRVADRLRAHKEWVEQIPGGQLIITEQSSHGLINFEEPELVIRTIRQVVEKWGQSLIPTPPARKSQ